ncbi:cationic amino acid transporter 3 isoform X3 [Amyelois transitella]|uniref:cationic amino acid transporter 3 isoform X3 n=1 Tax=Amyelois transitella TaxID=680683 RepID=UPI00298FA6C0|nr:cationic amino acid transporter 3 isoform X3 [Amyelois transitella]
MFITIKLSVSKMANEPKECSKMSRTLSALGSGEACGARWTLGALLLAPLAAANSSYCSVPAVMLLSAFIAVATFTCKDLKMLAEILPPTRTVRGRRHRNLRSFSDFMAMWMSFLSHLVAVAICARILSATADHVTGGRTRRWLFGYETRSLGEPWPDVLGVTVVMVVCAMFMCGLEESVMFTFMLLILLYTFSQFFAIVGLMNFDIANINLPIPITVYELFAAGAPISYSFSVILPPKENGSVRKSLLLKVGMPAVVLSGLCFLYANMLKGTTIDASLPVTTLLEARSANWVCPVLAAVTVAGVCLALTELCPLLFTVLVALASPEWKVLTRSMTYESTTTGSPVLAVFTAGSLAAILAFACPLSHMITLMNASHLLGIAVQALHFIVMRCEPTAEQKEAGDVEYKRLGIQGPSRSKSGIKSKRGLWFIPSAIRHTKTLESIKSKVAITTKETEERECLLLDEYAGCPTEELDQITSCSSGAREVSTEIGEVPSDGEASDQEISSGDDSTDIDAVVKEYRDRIQVVTAPPEAKTPAPPCVRGARWAAAGAAVQVLADAILAVAFCNETIRAYMFATGIPLWLCGTFMSAWQPAHSLSMRKTQSVEGPIALLMSLLFLTPLLLDSWPAITLFAGAGVVIYARCERWCGDLAVQQARTALERRKLRTVSAVPLDPRLEHIDTLYITR